jgi:hypothetical protein
MNFGWFNDQTPDAEIRRTTLHEFGHALALGHEHQQPSGSICWNRPKVYEYYAGPPNNWSRELVDTNIFQKYSSSITQYSEYDPNSIMHYPIDRSLLTCDQAVYLNAGLSKIDSNFISKIYPRRPWDPEPPTPEDEITGPQEESEIEIEDVSETETKIEPDETDQEIDPTVDDKDFEDIDDIIDEIGSKKPTDETEDTEGSDDGQPDIDDDPEEVIEKEGEEENDESKKEDFKESKYSKADLKDPEIFGEILMRDMEQGIMPEIPMSQNMEFIFQNQSQFISQSINFLGGVEKVNLVNQNKVGYFNTENLIYKIQYKKGFGLSSDLYVTRKRNGRLMAFYLSPPY